MANCQNFPLPSIYFACPLEYMHEGEKKGIAKSFWSPNERQWNKRTEFPNFPWHLILNAIASKYMQKGEDIMRLKFRIQQEK
jgi:hypothetical protein